MKRKQHRDDSDADRVRLHKALAHPIRLHLLSALSDRDISPVQFARSRGEPVANVTYHFRRLKELGCIELVRTRRVGGSIEHLYRRVGPRMTCRRLVLDERGWLEVAGILQRTSESLTEAEVRALRRMRRSKEGSTHATVALLRETETGERERASEDCGRQ